MSGRRRSAGVLVLGTLLAVLLPAGTASAHPLGNFTVNHADRLLFTPHAVHLTAVVDRAEIPAAQALQDIAPDGSPSAGDLSAAASGQCRALADDVRLTVDGGPVGWTVEGSAMEVVPGAANLPTLRLTCDLRAAAALDRPTRVEFVDEHLSGPVGWREITADGDGVRLLDSSVPVQSPTDELRAYPQDLLASPIDVRTFSVQTEPGENTTAGTVMAPAAGDPFSGALAAVDRWLEDLIGDRGLTPLVGTLAVLLAVLLGSGHALLPGHGKAVMAAYLAGRNGRTRDAITVGATVTATHTAGVLVLGLALSVSSALAGDQVIRWLGVASGLLVAGIGVAMLRGALRRRSAPAEPRIEEVLREPVLVGHSPHQHGHEHHQHGHEHHQHGHEHHEHPHDHGHQHPHGHGHERPHGHAHGPAAGRGGLIGMGVAGGLVPSPSALIVLLASVGLGRTVFGIVLVLAYGLGMAGTLTVVGLLFVRLRGSLQRRASSPGRTRWLTRLVASAPLVTAALVLLVGLALVTRGVVLGA